MSVQVGVANKLAIPVYIWQGVQEGIGMLQYQNNCQSL